MGYFKETGTKVTWDNPTFVPESQRQDGGWYYNPDTGSIDRWWSGDSGSQSSLEEQYDERVVDEISNSIIELENKLANISGVSFSDAEMQTFLDKAIEQVTPYYEKRTEEIKAGIAEGKIQDSEDLLIELQKSRDEVDLALKKYDIEEAQTEEEFINTLAAITSQKDEDLEISKLDWRDRIDDARRSQVNAGIQTSGIGKKEVSEMGERQELEEAGIERRAEEKQTALETGKKYNLENITLSREAVQRERIRKYGTEEEAAELEERLKETAGITGDYSELGIQEARAGRNVTAYKPEALTDIEEEKARAIESRKLTLQEEQRLALEEQNKSERAKINAELARKQRQLQNYSY